MTRRVRFTPEAAAQARTVRAWWRENRISAANLFSEELRAGVELIARSAAVGRLYPSRALAGVRRIALRRTRFHVYYVIRQDEAVVVAVWSAIRGLGPPLSPP